GAQRQYAAQVTNPGAASAPGGVLVTVSLPPGFRYTKGSAHIDDASVPDPITSADGRSLTWTLPVAALPVVSHIRFTVAVVTGAQVGPNRTKATASEIGGSRPPRSLPTARAGQPHP